LVLILENWERKLVPRYDFFVLLTFVSRAKKCAHIFTTGSNPTTSELTTTTAALWYVARLERFLKEEETIFVFKMHWATCR
jgi:hypothetical protein